MYCPNCGSNNVHTHQETINGEPDVNICNGVLGYLCLGPIGILCAFLGGKKSYRRTYLVCNDCHIKTLVN